MLGVMEASAWNRKPLAWAKALRVLASLSQIVAMGALYVLWKQMGVPFWTAFERCFVGGVAAYTGLLTASSFLRTIARVQPVQLLVAHLSRLVSLGVFAALRYVQGLTLFQSLGAWLAVYIGSHILSKRIERHAMDQTGHKSW
jgi:hypothetical protein